MASTQVNGPASESGKFIDSFDPDDPEHLRQMRRPAEVKQDVQQMEDRARVSLIMKTQAFRQQLEEIVDEHMKSGQNPTGLLALQQMSELILPLTKLSQTSVFTRGTGPPIPIADIRGVDTLNYSKGEKLFRCKLASCYRLIDLFGWSNSIQSYITGRINQDQEHFLVIPYGMLYHELTASNLVKVDMRGDVVDAGTTNLGINQPGFAKHAAIHAARPDVRCIIHLQAPSAMSVSAMACGLMPLCGEAISIGAVSYADYEGPISDQEDRDKLARALGPNNKVLVLRNDGILVCGANVEEAFYYANNCMAACEAQVRTIPIGLQNITLPSEEVRRKAYELANQAPAGGDGRKKWRRGELEFEALMRHFDNAGLRTGYIFREPINQRDGSKMGDRVNSDVEIPPTSSSFRSTDDSYDSPVKQHQDRQKKFFRCEWLNTPNSYKKEEYDEIGTQSPKKYSRWVSEQGTSATGSTPVKLDNPNTFAPQGPNSKELREKVKEIRKEYYEDVINAGPQSRILEGATWEDAQKAQDGDTSGTSDTVIVVGAASKGIIQRAHQHNAVVYKSSFAPNPFDSVTDGDIDTYRKDIEQRSRGDAGDTSDNVIVPGPDGRLISTDERMNQVRHGQMDTSLEDVCRASRKAYKETSLDDITDSHYYPHATPTGEVRPGVTETCIDDVMDDGPTTSTPAPSHAQSPDDREPFSRDVHRSHSARYSPERSTKLVQELEKNFSRSKSDRKPKQKHRDSVFKTRGVRSLFAMVVRDSAGVNGDDAAAASSPARSTTSGEGTLDDSSPTKELAPDPMGKEKKKKKFRIPSFSKKKEKKEKK